MGHLIITYHVNAGKDDEFDERNDMYNSAACTVTFAPCGNIHHQNESQGAIPGDMDGSRVDEMYSDFEKS